MRLEELFKANIVCASYASLSADIEQDLKIISYHLVLMVYDNSSLKMLEFQNYILNYENLD